MALYSPARGGRPVAWRVLAAACISMGGCGATDNAPSQGIAEHFSKQFQSVQFIADRAKDKYETTAQYEAWCAKRISDNEERIASKAKTLVGTNFTATVPAEVGEYDADKGRWQVTAIVQEVKTQGDGTGTAAQPSSATLDARYWCSIVLGSAPGEAQNDQDQGSVTLSIGDTKSNAGQRRQRLEAVIPAPPDKARGLAASIPEKQPCNLWLQIAVLGVGPVAAKSGQQPGKTFTPSEASLWCNPNIRITRIELRRSDGTLAHVWNLK